MADVRDYIRLFDLNTILKWSFTIMFVGLVFIGEAFFLLFAAERFGRYPVFAALTLSTLVALLLVWPLLHRLLRKIRSDIAWGSYPEREVQLFLGLLASGLLMLVPGFITDLLGLLIYVAGLRRPVGRLLASRMKDRLLEAYEYLKLYDL